MSVDAGAAPGSIHHARNAIGQCNQLAINFKGEAGGWVDVEILDMDREIHCPASAPPRLTVARAIRFPCR